MSATRVSTRLLGAGAPRAITHSFNATRTAVSAAASITVHSFSVNKLSSTSNLLVLGDISGFSTSESRHQQIGVKLGSGTEFLGGNAGYFIGSQTGKNIPVHALITGHTTTGSQTLVIRFFSQDAASASTVSILNPNSTDDSRLGQTRSSFTVIEFEP